MQYANSILSNQFVDFKHSGINYTLTTFKMLSFAFYVSVLLYFRDDSLAHPLLT